VIFSDVIDRTDIGMVEGQSRPRFTAEALKSLWTFCYIIGQELQSKKANGNFMVQAQHALVKIRNGLAQNGLRYEWFKIRTTNNIDTL
jgi:hypothetical protein